LWPWEPEISSWLMFPSFSSVTPGDLGVTWYRPRLLPSASFPVHAQSSCHSTLFNLCSWKETVQWHKHQWPVRARSVKNTWSCVCYFYVIWSNVHLIFCCKAPSMTSLSANPADLVLYREVILFHHVTLCLSDTPRRSIAGARMKML
jgi:hypothetical protein